MMKGHACYEPDKVMSGLSVDIEWNKIENAGLVVSHDSTLFLAKDLVIPSFKSSKHYHASPLIGRIPVERNILLFFKVSVLTEGLFQGHKFPCRRLLGWGSLIGEA